MKNLINERYEGMEHNYRGLKPRDSGGIYLTAYILLWFVTIILALITELAKINLNDSTSIGAIAINYAQLFCVQIAFIGAPFMYCKAVNKPAMAVLRLRRGLDVKQVLLLIAISILCIIAFLPIANVFLMFLEWTGYSYTPGITLGTTIPTLILGLFFVALMPAIGEEVLFRGFISRGLKAGGYVFSMVLTGFMFSIFHGNAVQFIHQFLLGMILCFVYFISGSIYASMIIHFMNNAISLIVTYVLVRTTGSENFPAMSVGATAGMYVGFFVIGLALLILCLYAFIIVTRKRKGLKPIKETAREYNDKIKYEQSSDGDNAELNIADVTPIARAMDDKPVKVKKPKRWGLNALMKEMFDDPTDDIKEEEKIDDHADVENEKMRQLMIESDKQTKRKAKIRDRNIVILAVALVGIVWIINLIGAYMG